MLFTTIFTTLLSAGALAAPSILQARAGDGDCAPTYYTLSNFTLITSAASANVNFIFQSTFPNPSAVTDAVQTGTTCYATGDTLPNNNVCRVDDRKLLFDLRGPQEDAYYQVTHTWVCNGATWMSGSSVQINPLHCDDVAGVHFCTGGPHQKVSPETVRKICNAPSC